MTVLHVAARTSEDSPGRARTTGVTLLFGPGPTSTRDEPLHFSEWKVLVEVAFCYLGMQRGPGKNTMPVSNNDNGCLN